MNIENDQRYSQEEQQRFTPQVGAYVEGRTISWELHKSISYGRVSKEVPYTKRHNTFSTIIENTMYKKKLPLNTTLNKISYQRYSI